MGRLTLQKRRLLARGIGPRAAKHWHGGAFYSSGIGNRASAAFGGGNSAFVVYSRKPGTNGNSTTFRVVTGAGSNSVVSTGNFSTSNITITANVVTGTLVRQLISLVNSDDTARSHVWLQRPAGSSGAGNATNISATALSGAV